MNGQNLTELAVKNQEPDYHWAVWFLRVGLAVAFVYPAYGAFVSPAEWAGFIPGWIRIVIDVRIFLPVFSLFEIALAAWLLIGKQLYWAAMISAVSMFAITFLNLASFEIVFRDISLGLAALALASLNNSGFFLKSRQKAMAENNKARGLGQTAIIIMVAALAAVAGMIYYFSQPDAFLVPPSQDQLTKEIVVLSRSFSFTPSEIRANKGDRVKIILQNTEGFHDWVIDEFNARTERADTGAAATVEFVADKTGTFEYYCSVGNHRQMGMKGNLIVE